jgi:hypothetical protein
MSDRMGECYLDHYERFFKSPTTRNVFEQDNNSPSIQVLAYDNVFSGCRVFASLGLSHYSEELGQVGEVIVPVDEGWDDVPFLLANSLFYMIQQRMALGWGITINCIENICPEFVNAFQKPALYFTHPFGLPTEFSEVEYDGVFGHLYLGLFISNRELDYFLKHGAGQFEDVLQSSDIDPYNLRRPTNSNSVW